MKEIKAYQCLRCNKIYLNDCPEQCQCQSKLDKGNIVGPFLILGKKLNDGIPVRCLLCYSSTTVNYTCIRRQKSCGCKPRHIDIITVSEENVRYLCKKCGKYTTQEVPILAYCCEESISNA